MILLVDVENGFYEYDYFYHARSNSIHIYRKPESQTFKQAETIIMSHRLNLNKGN